MKVRVLFFGQTADICGRRQVLLEVAENESASSVFRRLCVDYPSFSGRKLLLAVNEQYVDSSIILHEGDQLAIFTPVSGG
jgi:molybdopterin converting factor small subunit